MVSNIMLEFIHLRLSSLKGTESNEGVFFGGMNIVVLGDLLQLPPVKAPCCFEAIRPKDYRTMIPGSVGIVHPVHLWQQFSYAELTQNMRQKGDGKYADLLNRLRLADTSEGMDLLEERVVSEGATGVACIPALLTRLESEGKRPVCLLPQVDQVDRANAAMLVAKGLKHVFLHAVDQLSNRKPRSTRSKASKKAGGDAVAQILDYMAQNTKQKKNDAGGMADVLVLAPRARVMLIRNLDMERGLFNGAMGTVKTVVRDARSPDGVHHVVVSFDNGEEEQIERHSGSYFVGPMEVRRSQFPLALAYAITIHKSQGLSLDCVVTDLGRRLHSPGMAYVALSRARSLDGLYLLGFDEQWITCDAHAVNDYNRLRKAFTDLPEMKMVRRERPSLFKKRPVSRPLAQAGLDFITEAPSSSPPAKKRRNQRTRKTPAPADEATSSAPPKKKGRTGQPPPAVSDSAGFVPLSNGANWCFANAAVQALLASEEVRSWAKAATEQDSEIRRDLKRLALAHESSSRDVHSTATLRKVVHRNFRDKAFVDGRQHDSSEFLECLLDLDSELKDLFFVHDREKIRCEDCGDSDTVDRDGMVTVSLKKEGDGVVSWNALLRTLTQDEREVRCDVCAVQRNEVDLPEGQRRNSKQSVQRELLFPEAHRLLLVRIPRFNGIGQRNPNNKVSDFKANEVLICEQRFRVVSAVIHDGETAQRGHYRCLSRHQDKWLLKSDESCEPQKKFLTQLSLGKNSSAAYLVLQRLV